MGLLSSLFGGKSKQTQTTSNAAYDFLKGAYAPATGYSAQAGDSISRFLGGDTSGFDKYKAATGYGAGLGRILSGVTGSRAAQGLLRSGSTGDEYIQRAGEYDAMSAGNYLQQLMGLGNFGLNAGQLIASAAPQTTTGTAKKGGGLGRLLGGGLSLIGLSDRRAKTGIVKIGEEPDGLGRYRFRYRGLKNEHEGVMADEVARLRPWALGPVVGGYQTVRYDLLEAR